MERKNPTRRLGLAALFLCAASGTALADPTAEERVLARTLFDEARTAMAADRVEEACSKFSESYRLDPGAGTLLNLGICHQKQGRTASAFAELSESVSRAQKDGRPEREKTAREHLAAVVPRLSRLTVTVAPAAEVPGLVVTLDGITLNRPAWGVATPVDPGEHVVEAKAPGKQDWQGRETLGADADTKRVEVPALKDQPTPPTPPSPSGATPAPPPEAAPPEPRPRTPPAAGASSPLRAVGWGAAGVGVAGLALGTAFGLVALLKWNTATSHCPNATCVNASDQQAYSGAGTFADVSTVAFVVGGVGLAAGALLLFMVPKGATAESAVQVTPLVGKGTLGMGIGGAL